MWLTKFVKREYPWIAIFLMTQLALFTANYREAESKFFPVVEDFRVVHVLKQSEEHGSTVFVKFNKVRDCELVGVRMTDHLGWRVRFVFHEDGYADNSYRSRGIGEAVTGPWWLETDNWSNIQIEALHKCDPFGITTTYLQKIKQT